MKTFKNYCFYTYTYFQIFSIFFIFQNISFISYETISIQLIAGNMIQILSMLLHIVVLTEVLDSSFGSVKSIRKKIQTKLVTCQDKQEKNELKILLIQFDELGPMNACGYFEINKSTLTSMLSVRYRFLIYSFYYFFIFSLTYIIILAQFHMSGWIGIPEDMALNDTNSNNTNQ